MELANWNLYVEPIVDVSRGHETPRVSPRLPESAETDLDLGWFENFSLHSKQASNR